MYMCDAYMHHVDAPRVNAFKCRRTVRAQLRTPINFCFICAGLHVAVLNRIGIGDAHSFK